MKKKLTPQVSLLEEGYREMAEENLAWAEMVLPLAREIWKSWDDEEETRPNGD